MRQADTDSIEAPGALEPTSSGGPGARWLDVCALEDIEPAGARVLRRAAGGDIAIFRTASDGVFALLDRCPHKGGRCRRASCSRTASPARCTTGRSGSPMARRSILPRSVSPGASPNTGRIPSRSTSRGSCSRRTTTFSTSWPRGSSAPTTSTATRACACRARSPATRRASARMRRRPATRTSRRRTACSSRAPTPRSPIRCCSPGSRPPARRAPACGWWSSIRGVPTRPPPPTCTWRSARAPTSRSFSRCFTWPSSRIGSTAT